MARRSKKARKIRHAAEFPGRLLAAQLRPPIESSGVYSWTLPEIRNARDAQLRGQFSLPVRLAESMRTDDALFVAYENRLAPQRAIGVEMVPPKPGEVPKRIAGEAAALYGPDGIGLTPDTLADLNGCLANHGIAIAYSTPSVRLGGRRVDLLVSAWPLEFVRWDATRRMLLTRVEQVPKEVRDDMDAAGVQLLSGAEVPIVHGDGRWTVITKHELHPWRQEACVLPGAIVWARHAHAVRDWSKGSVSHGNAKVVGEMPENMPITNDDGSLTADASAFLELLQSVASLETPVGIRPAGSKTDYIMNTSTAWQVWRELVLNAEKAAARIYLGTDGTLGSQGGAPGIDISQLFGVATTKIQGDLSALERGILTGILEPWAAINFGDSSLAPARRYLMPDADADRVRDSEHKRRTDFHATLQTMINQGFKVDQQTVRDLAAAYGIEPAPLLEAAAPPPAPAPPAPGDTGRPLRLAT